MPRFVVTFNCTATVYAEAIIEAETLADAQRIAGEMREADMPADDQFSDPAIMDRRDISAVSVRAAQ